MALGDWLTVIDGLLALPYPAEATQEKTEHGYRNSGPGYHVALLHATRDFWDDRSEEVYEPAVAEIEAAERAVREALTAYWGEPEKVDLGPYLFTDEPAPEPMNQLSMLCGSMMVWRQPGTARWVALAIGQPDVEFPIELLAAVAETPLS